MPTNLSPSRFISKALLILTSCAPVIAGCSAGAPTQEQLAIQIVLQEESNLRRNSQSAVQVLSRIAMIDVSRCPRDFQEAYVGYLQAWEVFAYVELRCNEFNSVSNTAALFMEGFFSGLAGDPFGPLPRVMETQHQLQQEAVAAAKQIQLAAHNAERVAIKYGARWSR